MNIRILGYVMARNEWPLLALSITHALNLGVERVVVVDHASSDETSAGLRHLSALWLDRVVVYRLEDEAYLQEATTSVIMNTVGAAEYDWVYVFDADEFMLLTPGGSLAKELGGLSSEFDVVRYQIQQWVAPEDLDENDIENFQRISQKAIANVFAVADGALIADEIEDGHVNFFDVPFPSKVLVRGKHALNITAGAHALNSNAEATEIDIDPSRMHSGHIPLPSFQRLLKKSAHGRSLIAAGFTRDHGWQNQLIARLESTGRLNEFWRAHSGSADWGTSNFARPTLVADPMLSEQLAITIDGLLPWLNDASITPEPLSPSESSVPLSLAVQIRNRSQILASQLAHITTERDHLASQLAHITTERDQASDAIQHLQKEVDAIRQSRSFRLGSTLLRPLQVAVSRFR